MYLTLASLPSKSNLAKFDLDGKDARVKYTIKNFEDERAPLADGYQGYFSDIHQDLGMIHQLELRVRF